MTETQSMAFFPLLYLPRLRLFVSDSLSGSLHRVLVEHGVLADTLSRMPETHFETRATTPAAGYLSRRHAPTLDVP